MPSLKGAQPIEKKKKKLLILPVIVNMWPVGRFKFQNFSLNDK